MEDLCLQNADQAEFDDLMLLTGLCVLVDDDEGNTIILPVQGVDIDRIGPITIWDYEVSPPTSVLYPEYHTNILTSFPLSDEQRTALAPFIVDPGSNRYRVWAR